MTPIETRVEYFRVGQPDPGVPEPGDRIEVPVMEENPPTVPGEEAARETETEREEKMELWMKSIKDFIRSIDVKAL